MKAEVYSRPSYFQGHAMKKVYAFADESGTPELNTTKDNVRAHYLIAAIICDDSNLDEIRERTEKLRLKHFANGEVKSSSLKPKNDHYRRRVILEDALTIPFNFICFAINKERLSKDGGFPYKTVFIKHLHGLLYEALSTSFPDISIFGDEHGTPEFQAGFNNYINEKITQIDKNNSYRLFAPAITATYFSKNSKDEVLIQLADLIAGSLALHFENKGGPAYKESIRKLIESKHRLLIEEFPRPKPLPEILDSIPSEDDRLIFEIAVKKAELYIEKHQKSKDLEEMRRLAILRRLLFEGKNTLDDKYIPASALISHIEQLGLERIGDQNLRHSIISRLRRSGVIISSCNKGYKIPRSKIEFNDYVRHVDHSVIPQLNLLNIARETYLIASKNSLDLLNGPNYPQLVALLDLLKTKETEDLINLAGSKRSPNGVKRNPD